MVESCDTFSVAWLAPASGGRVQNYTVWGYALELDQCRGDHCEFSRTFDGPQSTLIEELDPANYVIGVSAGNCAGSASVAREQSFFPDSPAVHVKRAGCDSVQVSWLPGSGQPQATGYNVLLGKASEPVCHTSAADHDCQVNISPDMEEADLLVFSVLPLGPCGAALRPGVASIKAQTLHPEPASLSACVVYNQRENEPVSAVVQLYWSSPAAGDYTGYELSWNSNSEGFSRHFSAEDSQAFLELSPGKYAFFLRALYQGMSGQCKSSGLMQDATLPQQPVRVEAVKDQGLTLKISGVPPDSSCRVQLTDSNSQLEADCQTALAGTAIASFDSLAENHIYNYSVQMNSSSGCFRADGIFTAGRGEKPVCSSILPGYEEEPAPSVISMGGTEIVCLTGLGSGVVAGLVVGSVAVGVAALTVVIIIYRKYKRAASVSIAVARRAPVQGRQKYELPGENTPSEYLPPQHEVQLDEGNPVSGGEPAEYSEPRVSFQLEQQQEGSAQTYNKLQHFGTEQAVQPPVQQVNSELQQPAEADYAIPPDAELPSSDNVFGGSSVDAPLGGPMNQNKFWYKDTGL
ncbi:MAG: hypothetical protein ACR2PT_22785 [Endozoicomonas sp.]